MRHKPTVELVQPALIQAARVQGISKALSRQDPGEADIRVVNKTHIGPPNQAADHPCWIAACFPDLALDVFDWSSKGPSSGPRVVIIERHNRREVYAACGQAQAVGILPGVPLGTALALCADLVIRVRDERREEQHLQALAECCLCITPTVCLEFPDVLLMEVQGSLRLFGSSDAIRQRLKSWLQDGPGARLFLATTPTPGASVILARSGLDHNIEEPGAITSMLGELPIRSLLQSWPVQGAKGRRLSVDKLQRQLDNLGIRMARELFRLPRDGLRRRFGNEFVEVMDKLLGKCPDIRIVYQSQLCFSGTLDLEMETGNTLWIATAGRVLLDKFMLYLHQHDAMASSLVVRLRHSEADATQIRLGHATGSRNKAEWMCLLEIHLERQRLAAPVTALELSSEDIYPYRAHTPDLFGQPGAGWDKGSWSRTLDELRTRLGREALAGFRVCADHRPEIFYEGGHDRTFHNPLGNHDVPDEEGCSLSPDRPGWLLSRPRPISGGSPGHNPGLPGKLDIVSRPERIESGWWDDGDIRRDYYVATDSRHRRLWIFRDLESGRWYLHGLFA